MRCCTKRFVRYQTAWAPIAKNACLNASRRKATALKYHRSLRPPLSRSNLWSRLTQSHRPVCFSLNNSHPQSSITESPPRAVLPYHPLHCLRQLKVLRLTLPQNYKFIGTWAAPIRNSKRWRWWGRSEKTPRKKLKRTQFTIPKM